MKTRPVKIGETEIGPNRRTYVIAEAGVNHDGNLNRALALIQAAADAGADAVKFQAFRAADLTTAAAPTAAYQKESGGASQREMLSRLELQPADFAKLIAFAQSRNIEFLATPFGLRDLATLIQLNVRAIKLASTDVDNVPLVQAAIETHRPLLVSVGAATADEIHQAVRRIQAAGAGDRLILLHCVSAYPTPPHAANLRAVASLASEYHLPIGFSDHVQSVETGALAVAAGACVLEKHLTLDCHAAGPDHALSLDPAELADYIARVRRAEEMLGAGRIGMTDIERDVRAVARKSVVAARNLPAGTLITADMLTVKRPGGGISPELLASLTGRELATAVSADTLLKWEMLR